MKKTLLSILCSATILGGLAQAQEIKSIGVTVGDLGNPFFVQIGKGATIAAKEKLGDDVDVTVVSSAYDLGRQVQQIDDFIAAGMDLILINAADSKGIFPAVKRAQEAGIKVVAVDVNAEGADATVTSNNFQAGADACQYLADKLNGKGDVVIINGPPVSAVIDRVAGCKDVFSKYKDINILSDNQNAGGSREGGLESMTALLSAFPKIDGVFAINDPSAIGADLAARQAGRNEFIITGVDGAPDAEEALIEEGTLFKASSAQDPQVMAYRAVEVGIDLVNGKKPDEEPILIPTSVITKENLKDYKGWTVK